MIGTSELLKAANNVCTCGTCVTCLLAIKLQDMRKRLRYAEDQLNRQAEAYSEWERQQAATTDSP